MLTEWLIICVLYTQMLNLSSVKNMINTLMLVNELFEEDHQWTNANNTYHTGNGQWSDQVGQWSGGNTNTYHTGDGMWEDMATSNYITNEGEHIDFGDIITARELIGLALQDSTKHKHKYFEFLKKLRNSIGKEYSTQVHQHAAKLAKASKDLD